MSDAVAVSDAPPRSAATVARRIWDAFLRRREASVLVVAIGLVVYFQASTPIFLTPDNLRNIAQATAPTAIVAVGIVFLLVSGEIDIRLAWWPRLRRILMHYAIDFYHVPAIPAIVLSLAIAAGIGLVNGLITTRLKVPSFVTTLGMFYLLYGVLLTTSKAYPVAVPEPVQGDLQTWLGAGDWASLTWCLIIVAIFHIVLTRTRWGCTRSRWAATCWEPPRLASESNRVKVGNFMLVSVLGAFAGIMEALRINSIDPNIGGGTRITFSAIAAAVIGGTALAGGSGTVIGALIGMFVLAVLQNGFNLIGISANPFFLIQGAAILISMIANQYLSRLRRAGGS